MRPSFFFGLYALPVRFLFHVLSGVFHPKIRGKWTGRSAAILKPAPGVETIRGNGGTWWNMVELTKHTVAEERFLEQSRNDVFIFFLIFFSDVCFGMVWIREESNCGKTPWNFASFWPCTKDFGDSLFVLLEDSESTVYNFMFWIRCLIVWRFCGKTLLCE